jgi:hypothetical protein
MAILFILFFLLLAVAGLGYREVPQNVQRLIVFRGKRLNWCLKEGPGWLLRWVFDFMPVDMLEKRKVVLEKRREFIEPNEDVKSHEAPQQTEETISTPDGEGVGSSFVIVSNVVALYHVIRDETESPRGFQRFLRLIGWHRATSLLKYTSINPLEIESRLANIILGHLRLILSNYPYQLITNLNLRVGDKLQDDEKRLAIRRKIEVDLLAAVNADVSEWGIIVTRIPIGDIDPDKAIMDALEALSAARYQKERVNIAMSANVEMAMQLFNAADHKPTAADMLQAYALIKSLENQGRASESGLLGLTVFDQLKGLLQTTVNITTPPPPPPPPAPSTTETVAA